MSDEPLYNDRLDHVIQGLNKNNMAQVELLGEIKLMKQRLESLENMNALKGQIQDNQIIRIEGSVNTLAKDIEQMKTQVTKAQGMFAIIAAVTMFGVGMLQNWISKLLGG